MKKIKPLGEWLFRSLKKTLLVMRFATFLLIMGIVQAYAADGYSQKTKLSISYSDTELINVPDKIEEEIESDEDVQQRRITGTVTDENADSFTGSKCPDRGLP